MLQCSYNSIQMHYYEIAPSTLIRADQWRFTYASDDEISPGTVVRIPIGKKEVTGVVIQQVNKPGFETRSISTVIEQNPMPARLLQLARWMSEYYATHFAIVLQTMLPTGLHKKRRQQDKQQSYPERERTNFVLNKDQQHALDVIEASSHGTILLRGVTGSGKTRVYIDAAKRAAGKGRSSIILVPEIALTPQLVAEFRHDFDDKHLLITHSGMTEAERHSIWKTCLNANHPLIIIGPRSALFMPVSDLGLVVIDEAHEPSFKQDQSPRYSTARAASVMAGFCEAKVILGSATPSISDYYLAKANGRPIITLDKPAVAGARLPSIELVSFLARGNFTQHRFLSNALLVKIREAIADGTQVLLFHNRRGTAPMTVCSNCGWNALCPNCYVPLTLHADKHQLLCHLCGIKANVPHNCPQCQNPDIIHKGIGTKLVAEELQKLFPKKRVARFDADNASDETLQANYQALYDGDIQLIVGTQVIAKGLDLPKLRTVGVLQADSGLLLPDYQAEERVFQLLYQVAGRVGRQADVETSVIVQTYQPNHPVIHLGLQKDYEAFYEHAITEREQAHFPPFTHLLKLVCVYSTEAGAVNAARKLAAELKKAHKDVRVLGPTPAFYERLGGKYRWQILLKSQTRSKLQEIALSLPKPWQFDLDPHSLL